MKNVCVLLASESTILERIKSIYTAKTILDAYCETKCIAMHMSSLTLSCLDPPVGFVGVFSESQVSTESYGIRFFRATKVPAEVKKVAPSSRIDRITSVLVTGR